jgi:hypothetical protein
MSLDVSFNAVIVRTQSHSQQLHLTHQHLKMYININVKNALHVLILKGSSSGAKSNKLTTHMQRYIRSQNSDKNDTII